MILVLGKDTEEEKTEANKQEKKEPNQKKNDESKVINIKIPHSGHPQGLAPLVRLRRSSPKDAGSQAKPRKTSG